MAALEKILFGLIAFVTHGIMLGVFAVYTCRYWIANLRGQDEQIAFLRAKIGRTLPSPFTLANRLNKEFISNSTPTKKFALWIHGCSAGEIKLVREILSLMPTPPASLLVTYQTRSGQIMAETLFADKEFVAKSMHVAHAIIPLDVFFLVRRLTRLLAPNAPVILLEETLRPTLLRALARQGHPVHLLNYQLHGRSKKVYSRFPFLFRFTHPLRTILTCTEESATAARTLMKGRKTHIAYAGNLKHSARMLNADQGEQTRLRKKLPLDFQNLIATRFEKLRAPDSQIVTLASSHAGEESLVIMALRQRLSSATAQPTTHPFPTNKKPTSSKKKVFLIIVPRDVERGKQLAEKFSTFFRVCHLGEDYFEESLDQKRENIFANSASHQAHPHLHSISQQNEFQQHSEAPQHSESPPLQVTPKGFTPFDILILSRLGLLSLIYALSDLVIIGDTLIAGDRGHNFLEATALGAPTVYGADMRAFPQETQTFEQAGATIRLPAHTDLASSLTSILDNEEKLHTMSRVSKKLTAMLSYKKDLVRSTIAS